MSEAVEQKTVELMDRAANAVEAFAGKLDVLATQYGPEVVDAAMTVARLDAANALAAQVIFLFGGSYAVWRLTRLSISCWKRCNYSDAWPEVVGSLTAVGAFGLTATATIVVLSNGLWPIAGLIEPKLWIAKQVLGL